MFEIMQKPSTTEFLKVDQILRAHELRVTEPRRHILTLLLNSKGAVSYNTLEQSVSQNDRVTIYRSLKRFEETGIIHKVLGENGVSFYALCRDDCNKHFHHDEHDHFYCSECDQMLCLEKHVWNDLNLPKGYSVKKATLVLEGQCEKCNKKGIE